MTTRVRQALTDPALKLRLRPCLPKKALTPPPFNDNPTAAPTALLQHVSASDLGWITEALLRQKQDSITPATLHAITLMQTQTSLRPSVLASITTQRYLDAVKETHAYVQEWLGHEPPQYEAQLTHHETTIIGHPDIRTPTRIFEIKTTRQPEAHWVDFLYQTFAYAALDPHAQTVHIVLPLQAMVWSFDVRTWKKRDDFLKVLAQRKPPPAASQPSTMFDPLLLPMLLQLLPIGYHTSKKSTLAATLQHCLSTAGPRRPIQVMFSARSAHVSMKDADIADSLALIQHHSLQVFVHSPYVLNLCNPDDYIYRSLRTHLGYASAFGGKGVVVHVGKSCKQPLATALDTMRTQIQASLTDATPECPLLLETPAGQGTETLTQLTDFMEFVSSFQDPRLGICIDTCHVFACGHNPQEYIQTTLSHTTWAPLLKLVHFNDSHGACHSCVDRHAPIGHGRIPHDVLAACATMCVAAGVPMVVE